ncbi:BlaI/MecI/CopY family transcriptional regulator [Thalassotalea sp. ND16A]|uniref:BlaI/MecI/CopY family transcriptional regulator n=1 Tax=Thalassotalea sp. ND16A TaxID=1535422 RepID=UPI00051A7ADC|nr:BlaI/MecI/CopY family transcriptional regulator [Thalassotalea sp. ND16A]KGJ98507.1 transcriptional repressor, CopY family [Thalassotalea sp. ND16A]
MIEISKAEFEVLEALWQNHPASASEIIARLNEAKTWHDKTVKTLLNRMVKKGAISFEKQQRHYLYSPLLERETYTYKEGSSLIERFFGGKIAPLVAGFAKTEKLSKGDIDDLKKVIAQWEQDNG